MRLLYQNALRPILFSFDPEKVHDAFVRLGEVLGRNDVRRSLVSLLYGYRGPDASLVVDDIRYEAPTLLAAGFDYNGRLVGVLKSVGFGGVEVGSVTARPSPGNPPPRLRRLVRSRSLLVNKGLRNDGVYAIAKRLKESPRPSGFVVGVSIARTNDEEAASLTGGIDDYRTSLAHLIEMNVGDFYTLNISCPNVHGGESFVKPERLKELLSGLADLKPGRPVYAKMPINREWEDFNALLRLIDDFGLNGVVIGNLNKDYRELDFPNEAPSEFRGGLSGRPCFERSNKLVRQTRERYGDRFTIIGCGGVMSADDAMQKMRAGADLVQLISGMIFTGPQLMKEIAKAYAGSRDELAVARQMLAHS